MPPQAFQINQLMDELHPPSAGKKTRILFEDIHSKAILFAFAPGEGLVQHASPFPAVIQIIQGHAKLTIGTEAIEGKPNTWIHMSSATLHSIHAETSVIMLLTLFKSIAEPSQ